MEAQELKCIATQKGYYENLIEEDQEFTLKDHRLFSASWMQPKRQDAKSKKLIAEAIEYQEEAKRGLRDARIIELEAALARAQSGIVPEE